MAGSTRRQETWKAFQQGEWRGFSVSSLGVGRFGGYQRVSLLSGRWFSWLNTLPEVPKKQKRLQSSEWNLTAHPALQSF